MPIEADVRPRGPFSLAQSARRHGYRDGVFSTLLAIDGRVERGLAAQRRDGSLRLRAETAEGIERLRFVLALDDDHSEFLRRFAGDRLLGRATKHLRGLRPVRTATVAHALLRAVAGQLVTSREARELERRVIRAAGGAPATADKLGRFSPAELQRLGLSARKAAALVRLCRGGDVERLRNRPGAAVAARLERERGLGPWSVGVVFLEGLGRYDRGLARDLGLIKLLSAIRGRWVEAEETDELLAHYGEWQGLASVYLLAGWARGLVPVSATRDEIRRSRGRTRYAA